MTTSNKVTYVETESDTITQDIVNKLASYSTLEEVVFTKLKTIPSKLNFESLKVSKLQFDNSDDNTAGIYIPKNVLKSAKNVDRLSIYGFNVSQKNINDITTLTRLTRLDFDGCTFDNNLNYTKLKNLKNLTALYLDTTFIKGKADAKLAKLPESICQLKKLKTLSLYRNDLTTLPSCIKNLANLELLNLNLNNLVSLPNEIGYLTKLKEIALEDNDLTTLPAGFGKLVNLKELSLIGNKISTLPDEVGNLAITKLDLSYNAIGSVPTAIGKFAKLEELYLDNNKVYRIPSSITRLGKLETLSLDNIRLR